VEGACAMLSAVMIALGEVRELGPRFRPQNTEALWMRGDAI